MSLDLTPSACSALMQDVPPEEYRPTLQVLSVKQVNTGPTGPPRMRVIISDGEYFTQAMLATQLNHLTEKPEGGLAELDKNTVIRLEKFASNSVQNKRLIILLDLTVLGNPGQKIGNPASFEVAKAESHANAMPAPIAPPVTIQKPAQPAPGGTRPASMPRNGGPIFPIEGLSPYQNKWTIKARVTNKSDIRHWSNQKGEGKLFSVTLMDETGEIRATAFNAQVDEFYELMQEGKVYFVSKGRIGPAKRQFSNVSNLYEITFERNTEVEPCLDASDVPEVKYQFVTLEGLQDIPKDATCDVIGVVTEVGELGEILAKATGRSVPKREISIVDRSGFSCRLTLWGKSGETFQAPDQPVIAFKGVRVGDYGGRNLSFQSSSQMSINPDIPDAHQLRGWYDSIGNTQATRSFSSAAVAGAGDRGQFSRSELKTIAQVKDENLGMGEKADFFTTKASVIHVKQENFAYPACRSEKCNKKVVQTTDGRWECVSCGLTFDEPEYRYLLSISVADHTGQAWLSAFNDAGEMLFEMKAGDLQNLKESDESQFSRVMSDVRSKLYNFSCRARQDNYNDQTKVRYNVSRMTKLDFKTEMKALVENMKAYM
ncbi:replication factor-a protein [Calocera viscosa TUFC12733]|uniref:Replication protein A subunit n=1 Tax=Calocera viscosa (strain TUFC12733) TaxID=1330018 RepID=A0A167L488_CALVF|nr:replication factor-a protein [Calocera viscosa TUFC12733]